MQNSPSLISLLLPQCSAEHCFIGSRRYMNRPNSDFDVMFHAEDRELVLRHLSREGIKFSTGATGSVRFSVELFPAERFFLNGYNKVECNFCFIEDYEAWKRATEAMVKLAKESSSFFSEISKEDRIILFANFVEAFGGKRPRILHNLTS